MKKIYTSPEIKMVKLEAEDIIQTSGTPGTKPKSFQGAEQLQAQDFSSIFE